MCARAIGREWKLSYIGYIWAFDWAFGLIVPAVREFYLDFFAETRKRAYSDGVDAALAKAVFQVDMALAPVKFSVLTLLLYGLGRAFFYAIPGRLGGALEELTSVGVTLFFGYFMSLGLVSSVEFLRSGKAEKKHGQNYLFRSLSRVKQGLIFSLSCLGIFFLHSLFSGS